MQQSGGMTNRTWMTAGVWIIATVAIGFVLNQGARILAPFAMAIFVWLVMEGFARAIRRPFPDLPDWLAHAFAIAVVAVSIIGFISITRGAIGEFTERAGEYESRINSLIEQTYNMLGLTGDTASAADAARETIAATPSGPAAIPPVEALPLTPGEAATLSPLEAPPPVIDPAAVAATEAAGNAVATGKPPTLSDLFYSDTTIGLAQAAANSVSGLVGDMVIIMIYVAFLYVTANTFTRKLDRIFVAPRRPRARPPDRRRRAADDGTVSLGADGAVDHRDLADLCDADCARPRQRPVLGVRDLRAELHPHDRFDHRRYRAALAVRFRAAADDWPAWMPD
jgi:hypothetical protein